ncbi:MAG TPA: MBL fold metallo-hydrolase [Candidatus Sulfotelmatobacter sp.]|nr:MBL fold metallo-hydrolase [Candidatus Sulfotelmatobacter sp.]
MNPGRISGRFSSSQCSLPLVSFLMSCALLPSAAAQSCGSQGIAAQVLGSGGPELQDKRASSSYLVWENGQARALIDVGGGSALRFGESGAQMSQLDVILFTHFHVDHSADFAALIKSSWFEDRKRALPIYGPAGNDFMPSTTEFVSDLFGEKRGAYRYLSELLAPGEESSYKMQPHNVVANSTPVAVFHSGDLAVYAVRVVHGQVPALAWRVQVGNRNVVFSGDTNGQDEGLVRLAMNADLFIAHNSVPEGAVGIERRLHMPPSVIGQIAEDAHVKSLVLSHRMLRTLGKEDQTQSEIKKRYSGPVAFANDLDCFPMR